MKFRMFALLVLVALTVGLIPAAAAQDVPNLNCLDLSEADCAIVNASLANTVKMQSFNQTFSFSQSLTGSSALMPNGGMDTTNTAEGSGVFVVDPSKMTEEAPYAGASAAFDVSGTFDDGSFDTSFVIVDGTFYVQDEAGAWKGAPITELMEQGGMAGVTVMDMTPEELAAFSADPIAALSEVKAGDVDLLSVLQTPGFLKQERLADETIDGQNTAVFSFTGDLATLFQNEDVKQALSETIAQMMSSGAAGGQSSAMMQQMGTMFPVLLESTTGTVTVTRWIGVDDQFTHRFVVDVDAIIDLFGGATAANATPIPPIEFKLNLTVNLTDINTTAAPTAPEGAAIVPAAELFPSPEATPAS